MKRCNNTTTGVDEIIAVLDHAEQLLPKLASIEFVMTEQEQLGLYSLIRNLQSESWLQDHHHGYTMDDQPRVQSRKLLKLLSTLK